MRPTLIRKLIRTLRDWADGLTPVQFALTMLLVGALLGVPVLIYSQPSISSGVFYLAPERLTGSQSTVRVDTSTTPNRTDIGCETDRLATLTVNCLRIVGAATTVNPSLTAIPATGGDTNIGLNLVAAGSGVVNVTGSGGLNVTGPLTVTGAFTKALTVFYPALQFCKADNTATPMIAVRVAANDWALARTAAGAETQNINCTLPLSAFSTTANKGSRLDSFSIVQQITVVNLTSNTFTNLSQRTFANNVANALSTYGGAVTITPPTVVQANPYVTAASLAAAVFENTAQTEVNVEWVTVQANTGVYRVYGIIANYTAAL
jgi:hypothetical protein